MIACSFFVRINKEVYKDPFEYGLFWLLVSPLAAFSFHPLEAFLEIFWVIPLILIVPLHPIAMFAFSSIALAQNVFGHLGAELLPDSWRRHPVLGYVNRTTWHNMHHKKGRGNYLSDKAPDAVSEDGRRP